MEPFLHQGQNVTLNRIAYLHHEPRRGDFVILHGQAETPLIKTVAAIPGDKISLEILQENTSAQLRINDAVFGVSSQPRIFGRTQIVQLRNLISYVHGEVPANHFLVLGLSRDSRDSLIFGFVAREDILGNVN